MGKRELLTERIEELERAAEILKEIRDNPNVGEQKICEKHGMDFHKFRRYAYDVSFFTKPSNAIESPESTAERMNRIKPTMSWYEILWCDVLDMRYGDVEACPTDIDETLEFLIKDRLDEREQYIVRALYYDNKTQRAVGEELGITYSRVAQICEKAIYKLRFGSAWVKLGNGVIVPRLKIIRDLENDMELKTKHQVIKYLDAELLSLKKYIDAAADKCIACQFKEHKKQDLKDMPLPEILRMDITTLDFSIRTFNGLRRRGVFTIEDLVMLTEDEIIRFRNIGQQAVAEIIYKLDGIGLHLREEES